MEEIIMTEMWIAIWATLAFTAWQFGMFGHAPRDINAELRESARKELERIEESIRARKK